MNSLQYGFFDELEKLATSKRTVSQFLRPSVGRYWRRGFDREAREKLEEMKSKAIRGRQRGGPLDPSGDALVEYKGEPFFAKQNVRDLRDVVRRGYTPSLGPSYFTGIEDPGVIHFPSVQGEKFGQQGSYRFPFKADRSKADIGAEATRSAQESEGLSTDIRLNDALSKAMLRRSAVTGEGPRGGIEIPNSHIVNLVKRYGTPEDFQKLMTLPDTHHGAVLPYSQAVQDAYALDRRKRGMRQFRRENDRDAWQVARDEQKLRQYRREIESGNFTKLKPGETIHEYNATPKPPVDPEHLPGDFWPNVNMSEDVLQGNIPNRPELSNHAHRNLHNTRVHALKQRVGANAGYDSFHIPRDLNQRRLHDPNSFWDSKGNPKFTDDTHPHLTPHLKETEKSSRDPSSPPVRPDAAEFPDINPAVLRPIDPTKLRRNKPGTFESWLASQAPPTGPKATTGDIVKGRYQ